MGMNINSFDRSSLRRFKKRFGFHWPPIFDPKTAPGDQEALIQRRLMDLEALPFDFDWTSIPDEQRPRLLPLQSDLSYHREKPMRFYWNAGPAFQPYGGSLDWFATSGGGLPLKDQIEKGQVVDGLCLICHVPYYSISYVKERKDRLIEKSCCFMCEAHSSSVENWQQRTIINGHIYGVGSDRRTGSFLGMGGRRFDIEFIEPSPYAGRKITTHDLWSGGGMPPYWRGQIGDTAKFLGQAERAIAGDTVCWNASNSKDQPEYPPPSSLKRPAQ